MNERAYQLFKNYTMYVKPDAFDYYMVAMCFLEDYKIALTSWHDLDYDMYYYEALDNESGVCVFGWGKSRASAESEAVIAGMTLLQDKLEE